MEFIAEHSPFVPYWPQLLSRGPAEGMRLHGAPPLCNMPRRRPRRADRVDDTDTAVIERRLLAIHHETRLLDFYRERRQLCSVDADRPVDDVTDATFAALADAVA